MKRKGNVFAKKFIQKKIKGKTEVPVSTVESYEVDSDQEDSNGYDENENFSTEVRDVPDDVEAEQDPSDDDDEPGNGIASLGQDDDEDFDDDMEYDVDDDQEREYKNVDMMKMISESASEYKQGKRFKPPTREELNELREAELLFKSNLFRLQVNELLKEIKVNTTKTTVIENALHNLKDTLDSIPPQSVENRFRDIVVHNKKVTFRFEKPASVDVVGSFLLHTVAKPILNVDVAIEMPKSIFEEEDYRDHIYHDKRALYLRVVAEQLKKRTDLFSSVSFAAFRGDIEKPILVLVPQKNENGVLTKFIIRLIPTFTKSTFKIRRLLPNRSNNTRHSFAESPQPFTPHYNNSIAEDLTFRSHLALIHSIITECPTLVDTILLFKVWLRQREMYKNNDTMNGFLATMLLVHLYQHKRITKSMSSYQVFKVALQFLTSWEHVFMNQDTVELKEEEKQAYIDNYDVVFVDPSGLVNLTSRVTKNAWEDLKHEAEISLKHLNDATSSSFDALFIQPVNFNLKYDMFLRLENIGHVAQKTVEIEDSISDIGDRGYQLKKLQDILYRGLGDRILQLRIISSLDVEWDLGTEVKQKSMIVVGFLLNSLRAKSLLDSGPTPENQGEADLYRKLWGNKAELRRFKDGRILLAVVWDMPEGQRHLIIPKSITFLLYRHLAISNKSLYFVNDQLDTFITSPEHGFVDRTQQLNSVLDNLTKLMRYELKGLPLAITLVQGIDPELRYTSVFPIQPPSLVTALNAQKYVKPVKLVIQMESSGSWPTELDAIRHIKTAFLLQISKSFAKNKITSQVCETHLEVLYEGYLFQVEIYYHKELSLLQQSNLLLAEALQVEYERLPIFHSTIKSFYQRYPTYGPTVRLVKRWLSSHMFSRHFTTQSIELLVSSLFSKSAPYIAPNTPLLGFFRFLNFMATFDFDNFPIIVDFDGVFSVEDVNEIQEKFKNRGSNRALYIVTPHDRESVFWTKEKPTKQILKRVVAFAKVAEQTFAQQLQFSELTSTDHRDSAWKSIFKTPTSDYNILIKLSKESIPHYEHNILFSLDQTARSKLVEKIHKHKGFKNVSSSELIVGLDPIEKFITELEARFHTRAMFFYDNCGGDVIGMVWKPAGFEAKQLTVADSIANVETKKAVAKKKGKNYVVPNVEQILSEIRAIGEGIVEDIVVNSAPPSL